MINSSIVSEIKTLRLFSADHLRKEYRAKGATKDQLVDSIMLAKYGPAKMSEIWGW